MWSVYNLAGTVTVNRNELSWKAEEPLLLRFDLDGWECGSDAPHTGLFEIPESALR